MSDKVEMIEIKTADLIDQALDWAMAQAEGIRHAIFHGDVFKVPHPMNYGADFYRYIPTGSWEQAGPLIEKYSIEILHYGQPYNRYWSAQNPDVAPALRGKTPLTAICRCIVHAKLGETVLVPKELVK